MLLTSIYMDFWNFTLAIKNYDPEFRVDWNTIAGVFLQEAGTVLGYDAPLILQDFNIIGSYAQSDADKELRKWTTSFLPKVKGVKIHFTERKKKKSGPRCPGCHALVNICPMCKSNMAGTEEKRNDTFITVSMIQDAWFKKVDVAILVSADEDFIPAVNFINNLGIKVIHAQFGSHGHNLSNACWGRFNILQTLDRIKRNKPQ